MQKFIKFPYLIVETQFEIKSTFVIDLKNMFKTFLF